MVSKMHSGIYLEINNQQENDLIAIAEIVDFCCNTNTYSCTVYEATLKIIAEKPYCWKHVESHINNRLVEKKKRNTQGDRRKIYNAVSQQLQSLSFRRSILYF
jgi:hypothetical protein